jgi:hypothetical protein
MRLTNIWAETLTVVYVNVLGQAIAVTITRPAINVKKKNTTMGKNEKIKEIWS